MLYLSPTAIDVRLCYHLFHYFNQFLLLQISLIVKKVLQVQLYTGTVLSFIFKVCLSVNMTFSFKHVAIINTPIYFIRIVNSELLNLEFTVMACVVD